MSSRRSAKKSADAHWRAVQRPPHQVKVENETRKQRPQREKYRSAVGRQRISRGQRARHKRRPQSHQNSGDHTHHNALARNGTPSARQRRIRFAVENHRDNRERHAQRQQPRIPLWLQFVAQRHADHQRDPYGNGECNRQSRHVDSRDQQQIRQIENRAARERGSHVRAARRVNIFNKGKRPAVNAAHGQREDQRNQENADGVVPVEKFEAVILHAFVSVGPRAPADGAGDDHQQRDGKTMRRVHEFSVFAYSHAARAHKLAATAGRCSRMKETTSLYFDMARAPTFVQHSAAHAFANAPTRSSSQFCSSPNDNPPMNASPAPVVSTGFTVNAGTCTVFSELASRQPFAPIVMATICGPICKSFFAMRSGSSSPVNSTAAALPGFSTSTNFSDAANSSCVPKLHWQKKFGETSRSKITRTPAARATSIA